MHATTNRGLLLVGLTTAVVPTVLLFLAVNSFFFVPLLIGIGVVLFAVRRPPAFPSTSWMCVLLCVIASMGPFVAAAYANRSGYPVRIVVPDNFSDDFRIIKDHARGQSPAFENKTWVYHIPPSGTLYVTDDSPFFRWHQEAVVDSKGRAVAARSLGTIAGSIKTSPNSSYGSTELDGTTHTWEVPELSKPD